MAFTMEIIKNKIHIQSQNRNQNQNHNHSANANAHGSASGSGSGTGTDTPLLLLLLGGSPHKKHIKKKHNFQKLSRSLRGSLGGLGEASQRPKSQESKIPKIQ